MSDYRCQCGGVRHKCDILRIAELEAELAEAKWTIDEMSDHLDPAIKDIDKFWQDLGNRWVERSTS